MRDNEKIGRLQSELLRLQAVMAGSDAHASKCVKMGLAFQDTYPEEYADYLAARERYNEIEALLREELAKPEEEEGEV